MKQTMSISNRVHVTLSAQPIRHGVPWPRGVLWPDTPIAVTDQLGQPIRTATRTLNTWPDGSVQWSLVDLSLDLAPSVQQTICIEAGKECLRLQETCLNGLTASVAPGESLLQDWVLGTFDVVVTDKDGVTYSAAQCRGREAIVEEASALRHTLRISGKHEAEDGRTLMDFWIRFTITADRDDVRVTYHYRNCETAEPGIEIRSLAMVFQPELPSDATRAIMQTNRGRRFRTTPCRFSEDVEICASHSMDLASCSWSSHGDGRVFIRQPELLRDDPAQKPWFLRDTQDFKFQAANRPEAYVWSYLALVSDEGSILVAGENMIGLHPKSLAVKGREIRYSIWPEWAGPMPITQGEGRTLNFSISPLPPQATDEQIVQRYLSWEVSGVFSHLGTHPPVDVALDPAHVRACAVFQVDKLPPYLPLERLAFERKVQNTWAPDSPAPANGHWHYGDVFYGWDIGGNNEEMAGHIWFQEYLRTGRSNCLTRGLAQAQHMVDVDVCAHSADPYQNGGMCAHGPRHNHTAAYPSHMWFTELLFAYVLTGDEEYKRTAIRVCDNLLFWVNDPIGFETICADGRESGQPLINLTWTYEFAPEQRFLDAIAKIIDGAFVKRIEKHGALVYMKPHEELPLLRCPHYGEWAAWEGLYCAWALTGDEALRELVLAQLDTRLRETQMGTHGSFRETDYNMAAYAYYMSGGNRQWLERVIRPFHAAFRSGQWPFGYIKSMYFIHLAFEHGLLDDDEVRLS